ncbi:MAG: lysophospholipid acyltransferase family protein [Gemmatimonadetes bacterium]|nr:lysophospholipid acyltransferase family protein [Gemmatimonadota bacterium]
MTAPSSSLGCPSRGTPFGAALARRTMALVGWRVVGAMPPLPRFVLIVAPHTSNWDFPLCILAMFAIRFRLSWLGKHTLFRWPVTGLLRWLGGEPIERTAAHGTVGAAIDRFQAREQWVLGISPEGTRKRVAEWKTGFHRIAVGAGVPIVPVAVDYSRKVVDILAPVWPTADADADIRALRRLFHPRMARFPERYVLPPEDPA